MDKTRYFFILLFAIHSESLMPKPPEIIKRRENCLKILASENYEKWEDQTTLSSIFYHVYKTGCLVCSQPECDFYSPTCKTRTSKLWKGRIPVYNNILEFGLSGKYFPAGSNVKLYLNKNCYIDITIMSMKYLNEIALRISECKVLENNKKECTNSTYDEHYWIGWNNQFCLYFGIAIFETDKYYITTSQNCTKVASAFFKASQFVKIINKECYFNKNKDNLQVEYLFTQNEDRKFDGVPVILPCSPGGFVADPKTGRFVTGETCWKMFTDSSLTEEEGINFLIKYIYNNTEDLEFPTKDYRTHNDTNPIYLPGKDLEPKDIDSMKPKSKPNTAKGKMVRRICDYVSEESIGKENGTDAADPDQILKSDCPSMISSVKEKVPPELEKVAINKYIHRTAGCFLCTKPSPNNGTTTTTILIPIYNKLFEFGLSGQFFPDNGTVFVTLNDQCKIKIEIITESNNATSANVTSKNATSANVTSKNFTFKNVTVKISECIANKCVNMPIENNFKNIMFINWYCVHVALALHDPLLLFYAFSFHCNTFAVSHFMKDLFVPFTQEGCQKRDAEKMTAEFNLEPNKERNVQGVPIILPCSPGGYVADPLTGRFVINKNCDELFWDTLIDYESVSGILFIIKEVFSSNESILFKRRFDVNDTHYPYPIYMKEIGKVNLSTEMVPNVMPDINIREVIRHKCYYESAQKKEVTVGVAGTAGAAVKTGAAGKGSKPGAAGKPDAAGKPGAADKQRASGRKKPAGQNEETEGTEPEDGQILPEDQIPPESPMPPEGEMPVEDEIPPKESGSTVSVLNYKFLFFVVILASRYHSKYVTNILF